MKKSKGIPAPAVRRLSLYLRQLEAVRAQGCNTLSSRCLGDALGVSDAQVRKDLAHFGHFGHPGIGYHVDDLIKRLRRILGTDKKWNVLLVGAGNLGRALLSYRGFAKRGFNIVAVFDRDRCLLGKPVGTGRRLTVQPMEAMGRVVRKKDVRLGILAVPAEDAQQVARQMNEAGVRGILNFAPATIRDTVSAVAAVDLSVHLEQLSFELSGS